MLQFTTDAIALSDGIGLLRREIFIFINQKLFHSFRKYHILNYDS